MVKLSCYLVVWLAAFLAVEGIEPAVHAQHTQLIGTFYSPEKNTLVNYQENSYHQIGAPNTLTILPDELVQRKQPEAVLLRHGGSPLTLVGVENERDGIKPNSATSENSEEEAKRSKAFFSILKKVHPDTVVKASNVPYTHKVHKYKSQEQVDAKKVHSIVKLQYNNNGKTTNHHYTVLKDDSSSQDDHADTVHYLVQNNKMDSKDGDDDSSNDDTSSSKIRYHQAALNHPQKHERQKEKHQYLVVKDPSHHIHHTKGRRRPDEVNIQYNVHGHTRNAKHNGHFDIDALSNEHERILEEINEDLRKLNAEYPDLDLL